jgi:hypothetical protein
MQFHKSGFGAGSEFVQTAEKFNQKSIQIRAGKI